MNLNIALLPGDGIGPEIVGEAVKVLDAVGAKYGHTFTYRKGLVGACAIDVTGDPYPAETHRICQEAGIVLFGAIGDPKYDNDPSAKVRPEQGLLRMRKSLGLFANVRPLVVFDSLVERSPLKAERVKGADFVCIRELTGGMYFGRPQGRSEDGNVAYDTCVYSREEIERILKVAFEQARKRRKLLTVVDKANVIATSRLWRQIAKEMAPQYPDVQVDYMFVDNAAMQIIQRPTYFDVLVTENLFGDILTDESSVISGSLGLLPSASLGAEVALFEPIHGSYPQAAGKNIANPMATILSAAMLLEHVGLAQEGTAVRAAVEQAIADGVVTEDLIDPSTTGQKAYSTTEVGDFIAAHV
ncbi:3-isopropylmalate dehydrogenase [uncultured Rikenella sp.]|uniref:3-isopropylmalate dehydrogenase n=1 Tax=uncultured Rikenella sp. TaxID=368003 RepID=UPI002612E9BB|nr:3-isopropylmalate dehydrogenase [uncultured Rikenella sp.]